MQASCKVNSSRQTAVYRLNTVIAVKQTSPKSLIFFSFIPLNSMNWPAGFGVKFAFLNREMKREKSLVFRCLAILFAIAAVALTGVRAWAEDCVECTKAQNDDSLIPTLPVLDNFCQLPFPSLCSDMAANSGAREARIKAKIKELKVKAAKTVAAKYKVDTDNLVSLAANFVPGFIEYVAEYERLLREEIAKADFNSLMANLEKVKGYMYSAIDAEVDAKSLPEKTARKMKKKIKDTVILPYAVTEFFKDSPDKLMLDVYESYIDICGDGINGLSDNAFAGEVRGVSYIVMCPGTVLGSIGSGNDKELAFRNLLRVMSHELGHQIDSYHFNGAYQKMYGCLESTHAGGLLLDPKLEKKLSAWSMTKRHIPLYKVASNAREITADFWAARTMAQYLKTVPQEDRHQVLRQAYGQRCESDGDYSGTPENGMSHPPSIWRYEVMVRRDQDISGLLGCRTLSAGGKPSCSLAGPSAQNVY